MKMMKKLVVLVAAMTMALGLVACGGEKFPQEYSYKVEWSEGVRGEVATLTLNEDGSFVYTYTATDSKDANREVLNCEATGTYTKEETTVTITLGEVKCHAMNGDTPIEMNNETGYSLTYAQGATTFELDGDTFIPVE
ncbi:MAG: hypothetical protein IJP06_07625 [Agathobacter sp.]|nr:hypothetical protein [Agathobacter sp.]